MEVQVFLVSNIFGAGVAISSVLLLSNKVEAGPAMPACLAMCHTMCFPLLPGGITYAECMALCTPGCYISCFSNETKIDVIFEGDKNSKYISDIKVGDMVITYNNGLLEPTKVIRNIKTEGEFEVLKITTQDINNISHIEKLEVTPEHGLVFSRDSGVLTIKTAKLTEPGDIMVDAMGNMMSVTSIEQNKMTEKYTLETQKGTVLASNIFVTTICSEEISNKEQLFGLVMDEWSQKHSFDTPN
jgi:hypothetical protein